MHIKRYTVSALIFMILVGWFVYAFITQDVTTIEFFGMQLPAMPIAFWVVVPIFLFYMASVMHMSYYGLKSLFNQRRYQKDYETYIEAVRDAYLGKENRIHQYRTEAYKTLGKMIDRSVITPTEALDEVGNEQIDNVLKLLREVENGNIVELKKYHVDKENPVAVQNQVNQMERGKVTAEDILSKSERYSGEVCSMAYVKLVETAPLYAIEKYRQFMSKEALEVIARRINADEYILEVSNETLISLFSDVELTREDYLQLSAALAAHTVPDQRIKLFDTLATEHDEATAAYLYTLFDLELLAPVDEILENSQPEEYLVFKAFRALKECNKHYNIDIFVPALQKS
jgi:hypothetical protein